MCLLGCISFASCKFPSDKLSPVATVMESAAGVPKTVTSAAHFAVAGPSGAAGVNDFVTSAALCAGSVSKQRGRTRAFSASSREVPQAAGITAARRRCALTAAFAPAIWAKASLSRIFPAVVHVAISVSPLRHCQLFSLSPCRQSQFPGTDCCLEALCAAKCLFPGTAADRLSWSAATARRCGGLCAMALLAAAVA